MYRPKDLKNPFGDGGHMSGVVNAEVKEYAWEAGADAMLGELRRRGYILGESLVNVGGVGWQGINPKSKWYCIPDEEKVGA